MPMRVPKEQLEFIKSKVKEFCPEARVYLFGSRLDDSKKGGDIDFLILGDTLLSYNQKGAIKDAFDQQFGEQKIDLINFTFADNATFKQLVLLDAVEI
jgi:uncharacterized protein